MPRPPWMREYSISEFTGLADHPPTSGNWDGRKSNELLFRARMASVESLTPELRSVLICMRTCGWPTALLLKPTLGVPASEGDYVLASIMSALGDPFCWSYIQANDLFNDIRPVPGWEHIDCEQGSWTPMPPHNDEAFSDVRASFYGLLCVSNSRREVFGLWSMSSQAASEEVFLPLQTKQFTIMAHSDTIVVPLVSNAEDPAPDIRYDSGVTEVDGDVRPARAALAALEELIATEMVWLRLAPGEILVVNNRKCVSATRRFKASYDENDPHYRRLSVSRNLRRSRARRASASSRVIV